MHCGTQQYVLPPDTIASTERTCSEGAGSNENKIDYAQPKPTSTQFLGSRVSRGRASATLLLICCGATIVSDDFRGPLHELRALQLLNQPHPLLVHACTLQRG
jgi:hypothetical protein